MEIKKDLTTVVCDDDAETAVRKFLDHHCLLSKGKILAKQCGEDYMIFPEIGNEIYEITGPGGSELVQATSRWLRLKIDDTKYFVSLTNREYER